MLYILQIIIEYGVTGLNHTFSYAYKGSIVPKKGMRVAINFHNKDIVGFIFDLKEHQGSLEEFNATNSFEVKEIKYIIDEEPILSDDLIALAQQIQEYYFSPLIDVYNVMLPPSLKPKANYSSKPKENIVEVYKANKNVDTSLLSASEIKLYDKISNSQEGLLKSQITAKVAFNSLLKKQYIFKDKKIKNRMIEVDLIDDILNHKLNDEQQKVYDEFISSKDKIFLLQGVTGSGKTEVYIELVKYYLSKGLDSIILVPEIALTDRLICLFKSVFNSQVALLHSGLSDGQKYDEYLRIKRGEAKIVVGARSAIFAPLANLGLIIIDEEHVESYKQDTSPFYDAREVAKMRIIGSDSKLLFGSATPSLECKARAEKGVYHMLRLDNRFNKHNLPEVEIINLADYSNIDYDSTLLSLPLRNEIQVRLEKKEQVLLLLNRRGYSPIYICRTCQRVLKCPNCNIPLSYHAGERVLKCHHCDYIQDINDLECPHCHGKDFATVGFGTERVVEELQKFYPSASIKRLDADVASRKGKYHEIIDSFSKSKFDILVGTQMIAKGHDFPNLTLAVALLADQSLSFPNYRANEETFDLLTQLVGRAGRKDKEGKAIIQTYLADNDILSFVKKQDYEGFYKYELENRRIRKYPPFVYMSIITIFSIDKNETIDASYKVKNYLISCFKDKKVDIFGPSIPYIEKINNRFYRKIMLKYKSYLDVKEGLSKLCYLSIEASRVKIIIDVDPSSDF